MKKRDKANYLIQSVSHALDVMEELAKANGEIGVTELSKRLKLHKNNVFRLLATLELRGYAEQNNDTEDYRLGVRALQLGQAYLAQSKLVSRALPIVRALSEAIGETVSLAVLQNGQVQFPLTIESRKSVRVPGRLNIAANAKNSACGRLLLAQLPDSVLAEVLAGNTAQDAAIKNSLTELRSSGTIVDRGALEAEVITVARIVRALNNEPVAALEIQAPAFRTKVEPLMPAIDEAVQALSNSLGASTPSSITSQIQREVITGRDAAELLMRIR